MVFCWLTHVEIPICSMYGIFTYIWVIIRANVGKYTIHGAYGTASRMSRCLLQEFPGVGRDTHRTTQRTAGAKVRGTQELREPGGSSQDGRVSWLWYHGFIRVFVCSPDFWGVNLVRDRNCEVLLWNWFLNPIPLIKYHPILSPTWIGPIPNQSSKRMFKRLFILKSAM